MGTLKKRIEDPREIGDPNVVKVVTDRAGDADLLFALAHSLVRERTRGRARRAPGAHYKHIGLVRLPARLSAADIPRCRWGRWNRPSGWSNCARSRTATRSGWWKPNTNRWAWIRPRIWSGSAQLFEASRCGGDSRMAKYIFVTGGVVSSLGKGIAAASIGCLLESRGLTRHLPEVRSVPERRSRHHEPVPARRGLRHRRRRGDRSRPGPLRALHARQADPEQQPDLRPHLRADHHARAARRLSGQDRAGDSARHQRNQGRHEAGVGGCGRGDRGDRRHGGRHRVAAVPGSHPPDAPRAGPRQLPVRARDAGALDRRRAGAEDQAHPAQRQGAARHRYSAGHSAVPLGALHRRRR